MAWRWLSTNRDDHGEWTGFLEKGARLEGRLECTGTFRIDSTIKGTLVSDGTLILGKNAMVEGEITASRVVIGGRFSGTIQASAERRDPNRCYRSRGDSYTLARDRTWSRI